MRGAFSAAILGGRWAPIQCLRRPPGAPDIVWTAPGQIGVFVCLVVLTYLAFFGSPKAPKSFPKAGSTTGIVSNSELPRLPAHARRASDPDETPTPAPSSIHPDQAPEQLSFLENDNVRVTFTSNGAAVKEVELKRRKGDTTPAVMLNEQSHSGIMELADGPERPSSRSSRTRKAGGRPTGRSPAGPSAASPGRRLLYVATLPNGVKWQRVFTLGKDYALTVQDTLSNPGATDVTLPAYSLSVGRAEPLLGLGSTSSEAGSPLGRPRLSAQQQRVRLPRHRLADHKAFSSHHPGRL